MKISLSKSQWEFIGKQAGWKSDNQLLEEAGVTYSFKPQQHMRPFKYKAVYKRGKQFLKTVYCFGEKDFLKLLMHWNRGNEWEYIPLQSLEPATTPEKPTEEFGYPGEYYMDEQSRLFDKS